MGMGAGTERPPENAEHPAYTTVYQAAGGWQSMCVWWSPNEEPWAADGGFEEPWATGQGPYRHKREAIAEAREWAEEWGLEYRGGDDPVGPEEAPGLLETIEAMGTKATEITAALKGAATELERETGYRVFVLDPIDLSEPMPSLDELAAALARETDPEVESSPGSV
jgi:hypothetical protein